MKMSLQEKKASANQVLDKLAEQFGIVYTEEERNFNVGYLVALIDAAEQSVQPTASPDSDDPKPGTWAYFDAVTSKGG